MRNQGFTVWFTGLPCAGKSTLARHLAQELELTGIQVEILDGDEVRERLSKKLGYSRADRDENVSRIGYVANLLSRNGVAVIVAAVSPFRAGRDAVRQEIENFVEVYVKCGLDVCITRDVKGMYERALKGEINHFTGISDPYEPPLAPELVLETDRETVGAGVSRVLETIECLWSPTLAPR